MRNKALFCLLSCLILVGMTGCQTMPSWFGWPFYSSSSNAVATDVGSSQPLPSQQAGIPGPAHGYTGIGTTGNNTTQQSLATTGGPAPTYNPNGAPTNRIQGYDPNAYNPQVAVRPTGYVNSPTNNSYATNTNTTGTTTPNLTGTPQGGSNYNIGTPTTGATGTSTTGQPNNPYTVGGSQSGTTGTQTPTTNSYNLTPNTGTGQYSLPNQASGAVNHMHNQATGGINHMQNQSNAATNYLQNEANQYQNGANQYLQNPTGTTTPTGQHQTGTTGTTQATGTGSPYPTTGGQALPVAPTGALPYQIQPGGTQSMPTGTPSTPAAPYQQNMNQAQPGGMQPFMPGSSHNGLENRNSGGSASAYSGTAS